MQEKKRQKYLESAMIVNRLLDSRYFPAVMEALGKENKEEGKRAFSKLCTKIEIADGMIDTLWNTFVEADKEMANEPGWILA